MLKLFSLFFFCILFPFLLFSQETIKEDTIATTRLPEVILKAFEQNKRQIDIPGSIVVVDKESLYRYSNTSVVNALNTNAGIRMEERSPGSYRLNIRGSSLRSPFGVRNVKIYYNNIPFTDPGGNTYLNQLGFYNFGNVEILKGPASSLYGAGTGGVMLIENNSFSRRRGVNISQTIGSFGTSNSNININTGNDAFRNVINYQHQQSNGYREQSALRRDVFSWEATARLNQNDLLTGTFLYGDLQYQTPGALNLKEYEASPRSARPQAGTSAGAKEKKAAIYQKTFLSGISYQKKISNEWKNTSTVYGAFTKLDNPAIRNYARNNQPHFGGRTIFEFRKVKENSEITWHTGAELQRGYSTAKIYNNKNGNPDSLQTDDEINVKTYFIFSQLSYVYKLWTVTAGLSYNSSTYEFIRLNNIPATQYSLNFKNQLAPRVAILRKITNHLSAYALWSKGFSPPTSEEVFPTGSIANPNLSAEQGNNYEAGFKGYAFRGKLSFDVSGFYYRLNNAIVQRRDAGGGDYYTNAGSTNQKGLETQVNYKFLSKNVTGKALNLWLSHTFYNFSYRNFKQLTNEYSGNRLPGVPKNTFNAGIDVHSAIGIYSNITYQYNSAIPLDDANSAFTSSFHLLNCRIGYTQNFNKINTDFFAGSDNLLNVKYSLGNDINGFGGRFYNAAPGRNYFAGISIGYNY